MSRKPAKSPTRRAQRPGRAVRAVRAVRAGRTAPRLTREAVIEEAIALLGAAGLEGVSLRRLAARLHVRAPSLYWHFPDKASLLGAVMERIFLGCVEAVPARRHWQDWMRDFAAVLWRAQEGVRDFGHLLLSTPLDDAQIDRIEGRLAARLAELDLPADVALRIQGSVQVLVTGWFLFAHTPFSPALSRRLDFRDRMQHDLALLLEGEARRLLASGR